MATKPLGRLLYVTPLARRLAPGVQCLRAAGSVHIVPNWHDRIGYTIPFAVGWKAPGD